jgi:dolichol-phosphate mannosyltransferase
MAFHSPERASGLLTLVVPVFNEEEVLGAFYERTSRALGSIESMSYELIFIDDGSRDTSYEQLAAFAAKDPHVQVIKFSRNFGHQIAISAGIDHARGDCVAVIDADLQDPPEVLADMVSQWKQGFDVVYGVRSDRAGETRLKLWTASMFYKMLGRLTNIHIPPNVGDFRLMSRRVIDQVKTLREKDRFVRGLVSWVGFRQTGVTYQRDARYAGETKYPFRKMLKVLVRRHHVVLDTAAEAGHVDGNDHRPHCRDVPPGRLRAEAAGLHRARLGDDHGRDAFHGQRSS